MTYRPENIPKEDGNIPKDCTKGEENCTKESENCTKEAENCTKEGNEFIKERRKFLKAQRQIYKIISRNARTTAVQMSEEMEISLRQVKTYLKRLTDLKLIAREGGRKMGEWKIIDEDYDKFFERI